MWHLSKKSQLKKKKCAQLFLYTYSHGVCAREETWAVKFKVLHVLEKSDNFFLKTIQKQPSFRYQYNGPSPCQLLSCFDTVLITTKVLTLHCSLAYYLANGCLPLWYYSPLVDGYFKCSFCHQSWSRMPVVFSVLFCSSATAGIHIAPGEILCVLLASSLGFPVRYMYVIMSFLLSCSFYENNMSSLIKQRFCFWILLLIKIYS